MTVDQRAGHAPGIRSQMRRPGDMTPSGTFVAPCGHALPLAHYTFQARAGKYRVTSYCYTCQASVDALVDDVSDGAQRDYDGTLLAW